MIDIQPIEIDGKYFVEIVMDSEKMNQHGPYDDLSTAEAAARRLAGVCAVLGQVTRMFEPMVEK